MSLVAEVLESKDDNDDRLRFDEGKEEVVAFVKTGGTCGVVFEVALLGGLPGPRPLPLDVDLPGRPTEAPVLFLGRPRAPRVDDGRSAIGSLDRPPRLLLRLEVNVSDRVPSSTPSSICPRFRFTVKVDGLSSL